MSHFVSHLLPLRRTWLPFCSFGAPWDFFWFPLGHPGAHFGSLWVTLGLPLVPFGPPLGSLWFPLGHPRAPFGSQGPDLPPEAAGGDCRGGRGHEKWSKLMEGLSNIDISEFRSGVRCVRGSQSEPKTLARATLPHAPEARMT